ncbi:hypothetical protein HKBW3S47_02252, partial [Candidatus Hakubella thermalkaliphila]
PHLLGIYDDIYITLILLLRRCEIILWMEEGASQIPTTFFKGVWLKIAWVTIPDGLVKFINQVSGLTSCIKEATSHIFGIVLTAIANPPGPVVSCPKTPNLKGTFSSIILTSSPPHSYGTDNKGCLFHTNFYILGIS